MQRIGPYVLLGELGRGGLGVVYRARREGGPEVALKVPSGLEPEDRLRFVEEARALTRVRDLGLAAILEADLAGPQPFLAMELIPGQSLQARLNQTGAWPLASALGVMRELVRTVSRLHGAGVIHRDLKPQNVILRAGDDAPVLIDLGLALLLDRATRLTRTGDVLGTPQWMPPEQASSERLAMGPACDVYGLGGILYALLCGGPPVAPGPLLQVLHDVMHTAPLPPSRRRDDVSPALDALVLRCLAKRPEQRPTLVELELGLTAALSEAPRRPAARSPALAVLGVGLGLLALGGLVALGIASAREGAPAAGVTAASVDPPPAAVDSTGPAAPSPASDPIEPLFQRARELLGARQLEAARDVIEAGLAAHPDTPCLLALRGELQARAGRYPEALDDLDRALQGDPGQTSAWAMRGAVHESRGELVAALEDYRAARRLQPGDPDLIVACGSVLARLGQPDPALADLTEALALEPDHPLALIERAFVRVGLGQPEAARADLDRALEQRPDDARALALRGRVRFELSDCAGALADLDRSLALDPRSPWALEWRGDVHWALGNLQEAVADWGAAVENLPPEGRDARRLTARVVSGERVVGRVRRFSPGMIDDDPQQVCALLEGIEPALLDSVRLLVMRAAAEARMNQPQAARRDLDRALTLDPANAVAWLSRGRLLAELGELPAALADLRRALALQSPNAPAERRELIEREIADLERRLGR